MADYFADSSAVIKRYVSETGSLWLQQELDDPGNLVYISAVTPVQILAAISRRRRQGSLTDVDAAAASGEFKKDLPSEYDRVRFTDAI